MYANIFYINREGTEDISFVTENDDIILLATIEAAEVITEWSMKWPGFDPDEMDMAIRLDTADATRRYAEMDNAKMMYDSTKETV